MAKKRYRLVVTTFAPANELLVGEQGSYIISGQPATIRKAGVLEALQGSYILTGQTTTFRQTSILDAAQGSYTLTGQAATLTETSFPTVTDTLTQQYPTLRTSFSVDMPPFVENGDLLVMAVAGGKNSGLTLSTPAGWSPMHNHTNSDNRFGVFFKTADGTEGGTSVSATFSNNVTGCSIVYRIKGWGDFESTGLAEGVSTSPDPASFNPSWTANDTLWIPIIMVDQSTNITSAPTNYDNLVTVTSGSGNSCSLGTATRNLNIETEDAGAFTLGSSQSWEASINAVSQVTPNILTAETGVYNLTGQNATISEQAPTGGSREGDETALEDLNASLGNLPSGWSSNISLSSPPTGVTVESIGGELRVTEIDLSDQGITGSIDTLTFGNLTELTYFDVCFNDLSTNFPQGITNCTKMEYLYLNRSDDVEPRDTPPHEEQFVGGQSLHPGKEEGTSSSARHNHIFGSIPSSIDNLSQLKWFFCSWTDANPDEKNGVENLPDSIWNIDTIEGFEFFHNANCSDHSFPASMAHMVNLKYLTFGGRNASGMGTAFDEDGGWLVGSFPSDFGQLNLKQFYMNGMSRMNNFPDLTGCLDMININMDRCNLHNEPFPQFLLDGTLGSQIDLISFGHCSNSLTGNLPNPVDAPKLAFCGVPNGNLSGTFPSTFFTSPAHDYRNCDFLNCNFSGFTDPDWTSVTQPRHIRFQNNNLSGQLPYLDWGNVTWTGNDNRVHFQGNRFNFADLLWSPPNTGDTCLAKWLDEVSANPNLDFRYTNQQDLGNSTGYDFSEGQTINVNPFNSTFTHGNNSYQWFKGGEGGSSAGMPSTKNLDLGPAELSDDGIYQLRVTNSQAPGLTLWSAVITIEVN